MEENKLFIVRRSKQASDYKFSVFSPFLNWVRKYQEWWDALIVLLQILLRIFAGGFLSWPPVDASDPEGWHLCCPTHFGILWCNWGGMARQQVWKKRLLMNSKHLWSNLNNYRTSCQILHSSVNSRKRSSKWCYQCLSLQNELLIQFFFHSNIILLFLYQSVANCSLPIHNFSSA